MAKVTVGLPQGTRDFGPDVVRKRSYIFNTIKHVFELYGFQPLETPAMENIETLMGKYGDEGDKLIYRVLDSGNPFSKNLVVALGNVFKKFHDDTEKTGLKSPFNSPLWEIPPDLLAGFSSYLLYNDHFKSKFLPKLKLEIAGKALKYDLTIPFARYVAMNYNKLTFPFKRYQMQPVWRADRPQKGRYREFYQCDADVVGSNSLLNEVELAMIYFNVFEKLRIEVEIKINSRKILTALAEICGGQDKLVDITVAIDKLDKIGLEKVKEELAEKGLNAKQIDIIENYLSISDINEGRLNPVKNIFQNNKIGLEGIGEVEFILQYLSNILLMNNPNAPQDVFLNKPQTTVVFDPTLARGLNYYTGIIFEVKAKKVQMGSIGGGGRYDDLTGLFGVPNIPGVGISFGVDRIYDVMEELKLFPEEVHIGTQALFFNLGEMESKKAFELMQQLRTRDIRCELYPETTKMDKQFKYADKKIYLLLSLSVAVNWRRIIA